MAHCENKIAHRTAGRCTIAFALCCAVIFSPAKGQISSELLDTLQHTAFNFFWSEANPATGLIKDRSNANGGGGAPCSIASLGFGLTAVCVGAHHGWVTREAARDRVLTALQTLWSKPQGSGSSGYCGYKGFYYHFLDMTSALRTWNSELSTIDSGLLFAGILFVKEYFDQADSNEAKIRALSDSIYYRADWQWFRNFHPGVLMGWMPGTGFAGYGEWIGYNEAMIMYILAYGSPTHPITDQYGWLAWTSGYQWQTQYGQSYVLFPPLFGHQYSHCWVDFRNIRDAYMRTKGIDYFENSRRATLAQRSYCAANPSGWSGYSDSLWGITASDDTGGTYSARGAPPPQNDDGTLVPTAPISSLPFAPDSVTPCIRNLWNNYRSQLWTNYGFRDAFNPTFNWKASDVIGIDQGPIIIMIENYRSGWVWNRFMQNDDIQRGLRQIGFQPVVSVDDQAATPASFELFQNYPNPFNPKTEIRFRLATGGIVTLKIYTMVGDEMATLIDGKKSAGEFHITWDAGSAPSGLYFCTLTVATADGRRIHTSTKKMILIK